MFVDWVAEPVDSRIIADGGVGWVNQYHFEVLVCRILHVKLSLKNFNISVKETKVIHWICIRVKIIIHLEMPSSSKLQIIQQINF